MKVPAQPFLVAYTEYNLHKQLTLHYTSVCEAWIAYALQSPLLLHEARTLHEVMEVASNNIWGEGGQDITSFERPK